MSKMTVEKMATMNGGQYVAGNTRVALCGYMLGVAMFGTGQMAVDASNAFETFGCGAFY